GDKFDIHGGGIDLIFPHHENEIAQSEGLGKPFAEHWIHHGLLTINGQKMAKSLGNFVTINDVLNRFNADTLKMFYLQAHYSSPVDFTWKKLEEADKTMQRFEILFIRTEQVRKAGMTAVGRTADFIEKNKNNFIRAMDDDFNTPSAVASLFDLITDTHKFIDTEKHIAGYAEIINGAESAVKELGRNILGLNLKLFTQLSKEEEDLINQRREARNRKDFRTADQIREELRKKGIIVEDTKDGQVWRRLGLV
ncbi:MAG: hypothetical protein AMJ95_09735, partial [Omnitrophica WOR_2 bacterium SM23_72]